MTIKGVEPLLKHNSRRKFMTGIILHHTGGASAESTIRYMQRPDVQASYHYLIGRDGVIHKCVPISKRAWHAGRSVGKHGKDVNSQTIGISFANYGDGEEYPGVQVQAAHDLVKVLTEVHPELDWISTHRLITNRKIDPAHFNFRGFCSQHSGLKMWRDVTLNRDWNG